jgi:hypothetical protein
LYQFPCRPPAQRLVTPGSLRLRCGRTYIFKSLIFNFFPTDSNRRLTSS